MRSLVWGVGCVCSEGSGRLCDGNLGVGMQGLTDPSGRVSGEENGAVMLVDADGGCHLTVSGLAQGATEFNRVHASNQARQEASPPLRSTFATTLQTHYVIQKFGP